MSWPPVGGAVTNIGGPALRLFQSLDLVAAARRRVTRLYRPALPYSLIAQKIGWQSRGSRPVIDGPAMSLGSVPVALVGPLVAGSGPV
jgi:hypothetical protein